MGYSTTFNGHFTLDKPLAPEHAAYLKAFADTRRMRRDTTKATASDPVRVAANLPLGPEGGYFVGGDGFSDKSVTDYNEPPRGQPSLWCQWVPTQDNLGIEWDGGEKFYEYVKWLQYIVDHFLKSWGYMLSGTVTWQGEEHGDIGRIIVEQNHVSTAEWDYSKSQPLALEYDDDDSDEN